MRLPIEIQSDDRNTKSGLDRFTGLRVAKASDYPSLSAKAFRDLKEELKLFDDLPKAPTLAGANFLIRKGGPELRELFEDNWSACTLAYAAAAELYTVIAETGTQEDSKIDQGHPIFKSARKNLLATANTLKRSLQVYKYLAQKTVIKGKQKPGSERESVSSAEEIKTINAEIDTLNKLNKKTKPQRGRGRGFFAHFGARGRGRQPTYYPGNYRGRGGRRGRARGRGGRQ